MLGVHIVFTRFNTRHRHTTLCVRFELNNVENYNVLNSCQVSTDKITWKVYYYI